ncbi:MAG: UDP-N-acetylmuramoyl-L-alanine--D-glutamate ligase [Armatimonadetes bacterium]|nr:UDP-N-acetylmuramoyl-L-alanine--D-glutamate ligase [Armatimonadota bacterium]
MSEFAGKRVAVIGARRSGVAAAGALTRRGARVEVFDRELHAELPFADALTELGVALHTGTDAPQSLDGYDLVVVSPGLPPSHPIFTLAEAAGVLVWSEIELGYRIARAPIVAITGTNGKTTTTLLIHHILRTMGLRARLCGNIAGIDGEQTLTEAAERAAPDEWLVAEVSSFQLLHTHTFRPRIAVITNIRHDHLDYHGTWEAYALAKAKILANQTPDDWAVLNGEDAGVGWVLDYLGVPPSLRFPPLREGNREAGQASPLREGNHDDSVPPASRGNLKEGVGQFQVKFFAASQPYVEISSENLNIANLPKPALLGTHGLENALAAATVASILGCTPDQLREALASFTGAPHRMEFVGAWDGVRYINNSMCTNADALEKSLQATPKPCLVIAGGVDKNESIAQLAQSLAQHATQVFLIGRDGGAIGAALDALGYTRWQYVGDLARAVAEARRVAHAGDTVILAPGCASFDQFRNFADRGEQFKRLVREVHGCDSPTP